MIYLDYNATTPILREIIELEQSVCAEFWGNPSSQHTLGRKSFLVLEKARKRLATILGAQSDEIFFTSGGTEANNLAILGSAMNLPHGSEIIISAIEHPSVYDTALFLQSNKNIIVKIIPVDQYGIIKIDDLPKMINPQTRMISIMLANNETGTIQPISEISNYLKGKDIVFHTDAIQAFGKIPINVNLLNISLLTVSSHKVYGSKGCGAIYIKNGTKLSSMMIGGNQERLYRPGTENVPAIIGFVKAAEIAINCIESESQRLFNLTEYMYSEISKRHRGILRNGHAENRVAGTLNICIYGTKSETILAALDREGICASSGSACSSGSVNPSRTLLAMGRSKEEAISAIRFSLGKFTTINDVKTTIEVLEKVVKRVRRAL